MISVQEPFGSKDFKRGNRGLWYVGFEFVGFCKTQKNKKTKKHFLCWDHNAFQNSRTTSNNDDSLLGLGCLSYNILTDWVFVVKLWVSSKDKVLRHV